MTNQLWLVRCQAHEIISVRWHMAVSQETKINRNFCIMTEYQMRSVWRKLSCSNVTFVNHNRWQDCVLSLKSALSLIFLNNISLKTCRINLKIAKNFKKTGVGISMWNFSLGILMWDGCKQFWNIPTTPMVLSSKLLTIYNNVLEPTIFSFHYYEIASQITVSS